MAIRYVSEPHQQRRLYPRQPNSGRYVRFPRLGVRSPLRLGKSVSGPERRKLTQSRHSPTDPEARLHHQNQICCPEPDGFDADRRKAEPMIVRCTILCIAATFLWACQPSPRSANLSAYNTYNILYEQGLSTAERNGTTAAA